jgi:hypothetical protein
MYQQPYQTPAPVYYGPQYSGCTKFLLYVLSLWIPIAGVIVGLIFMGRPDPESKRLGQTCLILGIVSFVITCCLAIIVATSWTTILAFLAPYMEEIGIY